MVTLSDFLAQILQPYFFYSLIFFSLAFVCIKIFLKLNPSTSARSQSIVWLASLFVPVFVLLCFHPQILFVNPFSSPQNSISLPAPPDANAIFFWSPPSVLSITGLLCLGGTVGAVGYLTVAILFGKKIVMKDLHVVMMSPNEYVPLQKQVKEISRKIGVPEPKVGLNDDLMPNAFTIGFGKSAVIVFSLGILDMLDAEELSAVVSHELAHVRAKDYLFRCLCYALGVLSFFNPLSYFAVSEVQKQRELLADERGMVLLDQPKLMASVLTKLEEVVNVFPKASFADSLSASSFLLSPLARRHEMFGGHPKIAHRLHKINAMTTRAAKKHRSIMATSLLLAILVFTIAATGYSAIQVQKAFFRSNDFFFNLPVNNQSTISNFTFGSSTWLAKAQILSNLPSFQSSQESPSFLPGKKTYILNDSKTP